MEDRDSLTLREKQRHELGGGGPDVRMQRHPVAAVGNNTEGSTEIKWEGEKRREGG